MAIRIRKFRNDDAAKSAKVIKEGLLSLSPEWYSRHTVLWQIRENTAKKLIEKAKSIQYFVAVENGKILGIGGYSDKKIHTFFVRPEFQGKGIGSKILESCLREAKKEGIKKLISWASYPAEDFYAKFGFKKRKSFTVKEGNNSIGFIEMVKVL